MQKIVVSISYSFPEFSDSLFLHEMEEVGVEPHKAKRPGFYLLRNSHTAAILISRREGIEPPVF